MAGPASFRDMAPQPKWYRRPGGSNVGSVSSRQPSNSNSTVGPPIWVMRTSVMRSSFSLIDARSSNHVPKPVRGQTITSDSNDLEGAVEADIDPVSVAKSAVGIFVRPVHHCHGLDRLAQQFLDLSWRHSHLYTRGSPRVDRVTNETSADPECQQTSHDEQSPDASPPLSTRLIRHQHVPVLYHLPSPCRRAFRG